MKTYSTGAERSNLDLRDFKYDKSVATTAPQKGGERYKPEDIQDQHRVGICTAISLTQNAEKALGIKYSADFQYLLQKKYIDKNWEEGSSARSALTVAKNYGMLPEEHWAFSTDRNLPYYRYIKKLQNVPESEIVRLLKIASEHKLEGYASVPIDRDAMCNAIDESQAGIIARFDLDNQWYREPIEPLRRPIKPISGHLVTISNYDGFSQRVANTWGSDWADGGTAYFNLLFYQPTEAWIPYYKSSQVIDDQKKKLESLQGQLITLLQQLVALLKLKK